jgi:hypothetical protein
LSFGVTWCINRKADGGLELPLKTLQARLGHSSIAMTADVYGHLFRAGRAAASPNLSGRGYLTAPAIAAAVGDDAAAALPLPSATTQLEQLPPSAIFPKRGFLGRRQASTCGAHWYDADSTQCPLLSSAVQLVPATNPVRRIIAKIISAPIART